MDHCQELIDSLMEEDRLLRQRLAQCPRDQRETRGVDGALSFKETLGHIAFWDGFTVDFFTSKLDKASCKPSPPIDFEVQSYEALEDVNRLPFGEVLARYLESTGAMVEFLLQNWSELSQREREDFWVPLKHRRHHRITLFKSQDVLAGVQGSSGDGQGSSVDDKGTPNEMACGR